MAEIISISLNKEILEDIDYIQKKLGFSGRSEIVRAGLRNLIEEHKNLTTIQGDVEATLIITHREENTNEFSKIKHLSHDLVKTHIHQDLKNDMCMEILLYKGQAEKLKFLYQKFLSSKKIDSVKVIVS